MARNAGTPRLADLPTHDDKGGKRLRRKSARKAARASKSKSK